MIDFRQNLMRIVAFGLMVLLPLVALAAGWQPAAIAYKASVTIYAVLAISATLFTAYDFSRAKLYPDGFQHRTLLTRAAKIRALSTPAYMAGGVTGLLSLILALSLGLPSYAAVVLLYTLAGYLLRGAIIAYADKHGVGEGIQSANFSDKQGWKVRKDGAFFAGSGLGKS